jgi:nucleoside-diphosphate-sugar epimerase
VSNTTTVPLIAPLQPTDPIALVTGASGFLGAEVARRLAAAGWTVRSTGRTASPFHPVTNYIPCNLELTDNLPKLLDGVEVVVHCAGLAHQFDFPPEPERFQQINADLVKRMAVAALHAGVKRFVLISSVSVYGYDHPADCTEEAPLAATSPYGLSKIEGERLLKLVAAGTNMESVSLRPVVMFGPGDPGNVARLIAAITGRRFWRIGRATNLKCFLHVRDCARAIVTCVSQPHWPRPHDAYNLVGETVQVRRLLYAIDAGLGRRTTSWYIPKWLPATMLAIAARFPLIGPKAKRWQSTLATFVRDDTYNGQRFRHDFNWTPEESLEAGIQEQIALEKNMKR